MFELEKSFSFEAGHSLIHHDGKCREPHGHSYHVKIKIRSRTLQESGPKKNMVIDFSEISSVVKPMLKNYLDHKWLNDTLMTDSPTAEYIAKWIFDHLKSKLPGLFAITLFETNSCSVTYSEI